MAKLPKIKTESEKNLPEEEEVEDQNAAVAAVVASAQTKADAAAEEEPEAESKDTEKSADAEMTPETTDDDAAGENPETAPPAPETPKVVTVAAPKQTVAPKETNVRVALICDHSCNIGGVAYHFTKGKVAYVPEPVKEILRRANLLSAL